MPRVPIGRIVLTGWSSPAAPGWPCPEEITAILCFKNSCLASSPAVLTRLAGVENIVFCGNRSTADHIISSPLFTDPTYVRTVPSYESYTHRFEDKHVVDSAVEAALKKERKRIIQNISGIEDEKEVK